jgi:hypothetical protein
MNLTDREKEVLQEGPNCLPDYRVLNEDFRTDYKDDKELTDLYHKLEADSCKCVEDDLLTDREKDTLLVSLRYLAKHIGYSGIIVKKREIYALYNKLCLEYGKPELVVKPKAKVDRTPDELLLHKLKKSCKEAEEEEEGESDGVYTVFLIHRQKFMKMYNWKCRYEIETVDYDDEENMERPISHSPDKIYIVCGDCGVVDEIWLPDGRTLVKAKGSKHTFEFK